MLDWCTVLVPLTFEFRAGRLLVIDESGEFVAEYGRGRRVRGSGSASVEVRAHRVKDLPYLWIDGNPAKFFQGHNVDGSEDPQIIRRFARAICRAIGAKIAGGHWYLNRVDVNRMYSVGSDDEAVCWLRATESVASVKYRGRGTLQSGTWYVGQKSRYWTLKAYAKGVEMRSKRPRGYSAWRSPSWSEALDFASGTVRLEFCFRRPELLRCGLRNLRKWDSDTADFLFSEYISRLDLPMNTGAAVDLSSMTSDERGVYLAWKAGEHLPALLSRSAFYRWRSRFRKAYGIDIGTEPRSGGDVIPLLRTLEAVPVAAPSSWLYDPAA